PVLPIGPSLRIPSLSFRNASEDPLRPGSSPSQKKLNLEMDSNLTHGFGFGEIAPVAALGGAAPGIWQPSSGWSSVEQPVSLSEELGVLQLCVRRPLVKDPVRSDPGLLLMDVLRQASVAGAPHLKLPELSALLQPISLEFQLDVHEMGMNEVKKESCGTICLKYLLFTFNFLFWLAGGAVMAVGIWTVLEKSDYISLLSSKIYVTSAYILILAGVIVMVTGVLGCCATFKEQRRLLRVYFVLLLCIFLLEVLAGVLAYIYYQQYSSLMLIQLNEELKENLRETMVQKYSQPEQEHVTKAVNKLQQEFKCCGSNSSSDWLESAWIRLGEADGRMVPDSCCKSPIMKLCGRRDHPSNIYKVEGGCITKLENFILNHLQIIGAVGLGIASVQVRASDHHERGGGDVLHLLPLQESESRAVLNRDLPCEAEQTIIVEVSYRSDLRSSPLPQSTLAPSLLEIAVVSDLLCGFVIGLLSGLCQDDCDAFTEKLLLLLLLQIQISESGSSFLKSRQISVQPILILSPSREEQLLLLVAPLVLSLLYRLVQTALSSTAMAASLPSPLTTHVLNTAQGIPGANMSLDLHRQDPSSSVWILLTTGRTNADGRCPGLISTEHLVAGVYKLRFETEAYWKELGETSFYPYVEVVFKIREPSQKFHIPLLLSPFSYSTYRGS
ncbi:hypothetical protein DNTS_030398, partial [Danionella cerebrum]